MKLKLGMILFLGLFLIVTASAATTTVNLKTLPHHTVFLTPRSTSDYAQTLHTPIQAFSGEFGNVKITFEIDELTFDLFILVKNESVGIFNDQIKDKFIAGTIVNVTSVPENYVLPVRIEEIIELVPESLPVVVEYSLNETDELKLKEIRVRDQNFFKKMVLSGYTVVDKHKPVVSKIYYSFIGFIFLLLFFVVVRQKKQKISLSQVQDDDFKLDEEIKSTQDKLKNLESKKSDKIKMVKQKLIDDQKELMKLRGQKMFDKKEMSTKEMKEKLEKRN